MKNNCQGLVWKQILDEKKRENTNQKEKRKAVSDYPHPLSHYTKSFNQRQTSVVAFGATNMNLNLFLCGKEGTFTTVAPSKEISLPECELGKNREHSESFKL